MKTIPNNQWIYSVLGSHKAVDNFRSELYNALSSPDLYHPALVSIADQFINSNRISRKQLSYALDLINKPRSTKPVQAQRSNESQIMIDYKNDEVHGGADCPYCGRRSKIIAHGSFLAVNPSCVHANMATDAGSFKTAIFFIAC
jgi:hypothetical protein